MGRSGLLLVLRSPGQGSISPGVAGALADIDHGYSGCCAEVGALTDLENQGAQLPGTAVSTGLVGGKRHGETVGPCSGCADLGDSIGADLGQKSASSESGSSDD